MRREAQYTVLYSGINFMRFLAQMNCVPWSREKSTRNTHWKTKLWVRKMGFRPWKSAKWSKFRWSLWSSQRGAQSISRDPPLPETWNLVLRATFGSSCHTQRGKGQWNVYHAIGQIWCFRRLASNREDVFFEHHEKRLVNRDKREQY